MGAVPYLQCKAAGESRTSHLTIHLLIQSHPSVDISESLKVDDLPFDLFGHKQVVFRPLPDGVGTLTSRGRVFRAGTPLVQLAPLVRSLPGRNTEKDLRPRAHVERHSLSSFECNARIHGHIPLSPIDYYCSHPRTNKRGST